MPGEQASSPAAGVVRRGVVAVIARRGRLLVIERSQQVAAPGMFCFPGGGIEAGESEDAALRRELHEELAVAARPLERLWESVTPWGVGLAWWQAALDERTAIEPNPLEVASVHWLEPHEMAALPKLLASNHHFLAAWAEGVFRLDLGV